VGGAGRGDLAAPVLTAPIGPGDFRTRAYGSGVAWAVLLDRFVPSWQARLATDSTATLDALLAANLPPAPACTGWVRARADARAQAVRDVGVFRARTDALVRALQREAHTTVVVHRGRREPLWPQGFDPLNVTRADASRVLHTRFLRVGNAAGYADAVNLRSLTDAIGPHPLFNGIRRVQIALPVRAETAQRGDTAIVSAPGLDLRFAGATLTRRGSRIDVQLP
jgi:hypothetical protein